jgi:hypothetical protein
VFAFHASVAEEMLKSKPLPIAMTMLSCKYKEGTEITGHPLQKYWLNIPSLGYIYSRNSSEATVYFISHLFPGSYGYACCVYEQPLKDRGRKASREPHKLLH